MNFSKLTTLFALGLAMIAAPARADFDHDDHHPHPGYWCPNPGYPPPPPGYIPAPGYVFTCFAQNNFGAWFYATHFNPNFAQAQAMQFCAMNGGYCVPTGCR